MQRLSLAIGLLLVSAAIFAAGEQEPQSDAPTTIRALIGTHPQQEGVDLDDYYYTQYVNQRLNIDLRFSPIAFTAARERMNIAFAAGELQDLVLGDALVGPIKENALVAGQFMELDDWIQGSSWAEHPYWDRFEPLLREVDGHIYTLPRGIPRNDSENGGGRYFWNTAWLEEVGRPVPSTVDEFYDAVIAIKEARPEVIPISGVYGFRKVHAFFMNAFGMKSNHTAVDLMDNLNVVDGRIVFTFAHPNYRPYLEYMRRLYEEGLLDQEYFSQTNAQLVAKAQQDRYFMFSFGSQNGILGDAERAYDYSTARPLTSPVNPEPWWPEQTPFQGNAAAVPTTSESADAVLELLDWMGTVEGEAHNVPVILPEWYCEDCVAEGLSRENIVSPPIDGVRQDPQPISDLTLFSYVNKYLCPAGSGIPGIRGGWDEGSRWAEPLGVQVFDISAPAHWLFISNEREIVPYFRYAITARDLKFTPEEQDVLIRYQSDLQSYMDEMHAKFITGVEPISNYDAYIEELDRYGLAEVSAAVQAAYDRR